MLETADQSEAEQTANSSVDTIDELLLAYLQPIKFSTRLELLKFIQTHHIEDSKLNLILPQITTPTRFTPVIRDFLVNVIEKNRHSQVRGPALYHLANWYRIIADMFTFIEQNEVTLDTYLNTAHPTEVRIFGTDKLINNLSRFQSIPPATLRSEAKELAQEAKNHYKRERIYSGFKSKQGTLEKSLVQTVGRACDSLFFQLNSLSIGKQMPDNPFMDLAGREFSLCKRGGKTTIVDFWSSTCGPCLNKMPYLTELHEKHDPNSFEILGLNVDKEETTLREYLSENPLPFRNCHVGILNPILKQWGINAYPTILIIDGDGILIAKGSNLSGDFIEFCIRKIQNI